MASNRTPGQMFALVFGVVYVLIGILGFFVGEGTLILFGVNLLHSIVHLLVGAVWIFASRDAAIAKQVNLVIGVVYLLLGVLGLLGGIIVEDLINNNGADTVLHLVSGAAAVYFGTAGAKTAAA